MKVKELLEELQKLDPEMECIIQLGAEGNGYSPLVGIDGDCLYIPHTTWYGEVYSTRLDADEHCLDEDEWSELKKQPRCLVFYPVN